MNKKPNIILFDLEVLRDNNAITADKWFGMSNWPGRTLKGDINSICNFGYKYLGSDEPAQCINAWDFPGWEYSINDDGELVAAAYAILSEADGIITHNGKSFDMKVLNTRFQKHGFPPLIGIPHMDTKILAKRGLSLFSNSLNEVAKFFGLDLKMGTGSQLWDRVANREQEAMDHMSAYCAQDVEVLEQVFLKLRPFAKSIPNYNLFNDESTMVCPNCGSSHHHKHGTKVTKTAIYQRYLCQDCGTTFRTNKKDEKAVTL